MQMVSIRRLGEHPSRVVREVTEAGAPFLVTSRGRPVAVLLPFDEEALEDWILSSAPEWTRSYKAGEAEFERHETVSHDEVWSELA